MYIGIFVFAIMIVYKMFSVQLTADTGAFNFISAVSEVEIKASRGNIFADDVEKSALAISIPIYELRMDLLAVKEDVFNDELDSLAIQLAKVFGDKTTTDYRNELIAARKAKKRYYLIKRNISYAQMKEVKEMPILKRGAYKGGRIIIKQNERARPFNLLAARTIGYFNEVDTVVGLEGFYKNYLRGANGIQYMKNVGGGQRIPISDEYLVEPKNGMDIYTTIDINIQDVAERALLKQLQEQNAQHGCAVLMEVKTGHVKAIANLSRDENGNYGEEYNHAVGRATEPGSTFKLPSLMVALEDGKVKPSDLYNTFDGTIKYYDRVMRDAHEGGDGIIPASKGFALSSNVVVSQVINNGYKKDPSKFIQGLRDMGLGEKLGVEIKGEGKPYLKDRTDSTWSGVSLPWMSIGYETKFTPLQLLTFYNAVANNGKMVKPQFVKEIRDGSKLVKKMEVEVLKERICSEKTIKEAQKLLELVVEEGTGRNLKNEQFKIAGKTGTTQLADGANGYGGNSGVRHQASFCGYFPADNPKYSCIVVVAAPTKSIYGNVVSGTVFKEIADKVYATDIEMARDKSVLAKTHAPVSKSGFADDLNKVFKELGVVASIANPDAQWVTTSAQDSTIKTQKRTIGTMPNVVGMGLKDAVYLLENKGYLVKVNGNGYVKEQKIIEGRYKVVELVLS